MDADVLLNLPSDARRLIVVSDRLTERMEKLAQPSTVLDSSASVSRRLASIQPAAALLVLTGGVGYELVRAIRKLHAQGTIVRPIPLATAQILRLPPGHPRTNVVYTAHPVDRGNYIAAADFHRFLFQHKVAEALRLIRMLGASSVQVKSVHGWGRNAAADLGFSFPEPSSGVNVKASTKVESTSASSHEIVTTMTLEPTGSPSVPDDLVWFPHEPLWREIASARIESGLREFAIDVRSSDNFGITPKLKASIEKAGLEVGGNFVEHKDTTWRVEGVFGTS